MGEDRCCLLTNLAKIQNTTHNCALRKPAARVGVKADAVLASLVRRECKATGGWQ